MYKHFAEKRFMKHSKALFDTLTKGNENDPDGLGNKPRDVEQIMSKLSNIQILQWQEIMMLKNDENMN